MEKEKNNIENKSEMTGGKSVYLERVKRKAKGRLMGSGIGLIIGGVAIGNPLLMIIGGVVALIGSYLLMKDRKSGKR